MATSAPAPVVIGGKEYPAGTFINQSTGHIMQPTGLLDDNQQPDYIDITGSEYNKTHQGSGGFFGGFVDSVKGLPQGIKGLSPVLAPAAMLIPGLAPVIAGLNVAGSLANGKVDASTLLSAAVAANGLGVNIPGVDPTMLKTAQQGMGAINAIQTGNVAGMVNSLMQVAGASPDTKIAMNALNAATALQKNDVAGALNALNNITGSVDPKAASLATQIVNKIEGSGSPSINVPAAVQPATQLTSQPQAKTAPTADLNAVQSMQFANALGIPTSALYKAPKQEYFGATAQVIDPKTGEVKFVKENPIDIQPTTPTFETQDSPMVAKKEQTSENDRNSFTDNLASNDVTFDDVLNILRG